MLQHADPFQDVECPNTPLAREAKPIIRPIGPSFKALIKKTPQEQTRSRIHAPDIESIRIITRLSFASVLVAKIIVFLRRTK
jgi:hypothetical protein